MTEIELIRDPHDPIAASIPVERSVERLRNALRARGVAVDERPATDPTRPAHEFEVRIAGPTSPLASAGRSRSGVPLPMVAESFVIVPEGADRVSVHGADPRGLAYAVLELADRVQHDDDPIAPLRPDRAVVGRPANAVRSVARLFCSEVEDLPWFRDEGFWRRYLAMLMSQRFNRVSLTLGLGYNYHRGITDAYLYFPYPFLVAVPGYDVRVPQLPDEDRERNLAALRFASDEAMSLGLDFQLGLWTHAYDWIDSPDAHHTIEGLSAETHAAYCRDALLELLGRCRSITGLTFRIHGESGIQERSWDFWRTVFEGVRDAGRPVRLDLHAKGLDAPTLELALGTGQPVSVSPKFWAEHMGLPYHQAAIRELERPVREDPSAQSEWHRYMAVSEGSRPFTRYGFGDFLREGRPYDVVFRLWAGTQRLLSWGDPAFASSFGRVSSLAGTQGMEWCEPLTFKGREGTGVQPSRTGYADRSLVPTDDWEKYSYAYRLFGRLTYDPEASPDTWRRWLRSSFGQAADDAEAALAAASRILPLVTTAHHPSASNNYFWPEVYTDMPIAWSGEGAHPHPYIDTPTPRRFGTVSPLDPEVFSSVVEFVEEVLTEEPSGRHSPLEVARRLEELSVQTDRHLTAIRSRVPDPGPELRRWTIDAAILAGLGRFFAGKLRAAVHYELDATTGSRNELEVAIGAYRSAVRAWREVVAAAGDAYASDLTFGPEARLRGHWRDRLDAIEDDLREMEARAARDAPTADGRSFRLGAADDRMLPEVDVVHVVPLGFRPGTDLPLEVEVRGPDADSVERVTLRYRPMDQSLAYSAATMARSGRRFSGGVRGTELDGAFPLAYAFILRTEGGVAWRHPGLGPSLAAQPYFVLRPG
jgi:hypothetical protein